MNKSAHLRPLKTVRHLTLEMTMTLRPFDAGANMPTIRIVAMAITAALVTALGSMAFAQEPPPEPASLEQAFKEDSFSPYANRNFPSQVFWGDTHLHTSISMDAGAIGNRLGPEEAYRFARGEEVTSSTGVKAKSQTAHWTSR